MILWRKSWLRLTLYPALDSHVWCGRSAVGTQEMDPLLWICDFDHFLYSFERIRSSPPWRKSSGKSKICWRCFLLPTHPLLLIYILLSQNRMIESLTLFESVINSRWFLRTSIILFLNKIDVFKHKIPRVPLERYFQEYTGGPDINKAAKYILWRFMQKNRARLSVYPQYVVSLLLFLSPWKKIPLLAV